MLNTAYLSLGSNIEPELNIKMAVRLLACYTEVVAVSSVWETEPVGAVKQANYLNAAAIVRTPMQAEQLKERVLLAIEERLGRVRQPDKNAPRTIDIDIMLFNRQILDLGRRCVPDPELLTRPFVAIPLAEIAPAYIHPETKQTLEEIAASFSHSNGKMVLREAISRELTQFIHSIQSVDLALKAINTER